MIFHTQLPPEDRPRRRVNRADGRPGGERRRGGEGSADGRRAANGERPRNSNRPSRRRYDRDEEFSRERGSNGRRRSRDDEYGRGGRSYRDEEYGRGRGSNGRGYPERRDRLSRLHDDGYEETPEKWSNKKKMGAVALAILLALLLGAVGIFAYFATRFADEVQTEAFVPEEIGIAEDFDFQFDEEEFLNVAIFGLDDEPDNYGLGARSDSIMIASLNRETGEVRLASVYRDTLLELEGNFLDKANHAYALGGPQGAVTMLNRNLDLNIQHYVTIDYTVAALVVDSLGGVEIDVMAKEVEHINVLSGEMVDWGQVSGDYDFTFNPVTTSGLQTLDGIQALAYMRIRMVGNNDFRRAERQREVLEQVAIEARGANVATLTQIVDQVFGYLETNFAMTEMITYAGYVNGFHIGDTAGFPFDLTTRLLPRTGDTVIPATLELNVIQLHEFLFGTENFEPSETVRRISADIRNLTGIDEDAAIDIDGDWDFIELDINDGWTGGGGFEPPEEPSYEPDVGPANDAGVDPGAEPDPAPVDPGPDPPPPPEPPGD